MSDTHSVPLRMPQPSPLKSELISPSSSPTSTSRSLEHERRFTQATKQEQQQDALELEDFRKLALEKQANREFQGSSQIASASASGQGNFEPFVGSRVGSPIPDSNGLGWPGNASLPLFENYLQDKLIRSSMEYR